KWAGERRCPHRASCAAHRGARYYYGSGSWSGLCLELERDSGSKGKRGGALLRRVFFELRLQRSRLGLAIREVKTVTEREGLTFLDGVVSLVVLVALLKAFKVMQTAGIHREKTVVPGVPSLRRAEVRRVAEDDHTHGVPLGVRAVVADP